jgi:arylsulfatase A-like enzyme
VTGHYGAWVRSQLSAAEWEKFNLMRPVTSPWHPGVGLDWDMPLRFHNSVWCADRAIAFMQQRDPDRPFLLAVGFQDPHNPHALPTEFQDRLDPAAVPLPDYQEGELADKPPLFRTTREGGLEKSPDRGRYPVAGQHTGHDYRTVDEHATRIGRAYYYGMVQLIDQQLGRILDYLDQSGLADNTLIVFTSDHGELLGDHGLWQKGPYHYEQLVRVPLLIRWPAGFAPAGRVEALASLVDLAPTLLQAAGVAAGEGELDGHDLLPLLRRQTTRVREAALVEHVDDPDRLRLKTLITHDRKLTWYCGKSYGELYDLAADPREKINRWNDPAYAEDKASLLGHLLGELERTERRGLRTCYV